MKTAKIQTKSFWADCAYCGASLVGPRGSYHLDCQDYHSRNSTIKCVNPECQKENKIPQQILKS